MHAYKILSVVEQTYRKKAPGAAESITVQPPTKSLF